MDRRWITEATKFIGPYKQGVRDFMKLVRQHVKEEESILCPCTWCHNVIRHDQKEVSAHLNCNGMCQTYTRWVYHGETLSDDESRSGDHGLYESDGEEGFEDVNDINYDNGISTMLDDLGKSCKKVVVFLICMQSCLKKHRESCMRDATLTQGWLSLLGCYM
jgi:hypothetical protein